MKQARRQGIKAYLNADRLTGDGKIYTVDNIQSLKTNNQTKKQTNLQTNTTSTKQTAKHVMFFGRSSIYSNFHPSPVTLDKIRYICLEQAYQHRKALDTGDTKAASEILATKDPVTQKHVGDKLKAKTWEKNEGLTFMQKDITAKFSHNEQFKAELLSTKGKCFV